MSAVMGCCGTTFRQVLCCPCGWIACGSTGAGAALAHVHVHLHLHVSVHLHMHVRVKAEASHGSGLRAVCLKEKPAAA
ncbi:hypothetical protein PUV47_17580 [Pseudovibrio exalbescens]|uniref:hypothetical protein n=1 Tax=Pseudovibrio exalbescens TaxID=197461 RepID=UPI0023661B69|nr:hypothetical protein [Pseudovibrio exalbescens]MDD7911747.1 hypothetical protein [Pseudovibrio exalbescens]